MALAFAQHVQDFDSNLADDVRGIATGAGMPAWQIWMLNSRTEILNELVRAATPNLAERAEKAPNECTSLGSTQHAIIAQNWDWDETLEGLTVLMEIVREDGPNILMITEPGIIGKVGFNECGVGVLLNLLMDTEKHLPLEAAPARGVPVHVLLRAILDSTSFEGALAACARAPRHTFSHMLVSQAGKGSAAAMIELMGSHMDVVRQPCADGALLHTNHFVGCGLESQRTGGASSYSRFARAQELLQQDAGAATASAEATLRLFERVLHDKTGPLPICRPFILDPVTKMKTGTVTLVLMDLERRTLHLTRGNPFEHEVEVAHFSPRTPARL